MPQDNAFEQLIRFVEHKRRSVGAPGLSLAITDRKGLIHVSSYGYRNVESKTPVDDSTQFQFGSIGKSFTAIALLQLQEEGRVDLQAPVTEYLPWFQVRSQFSPIKLHHLLSHTAGITCALDATPESTYQTWTLRETEATAEPGTYFHYSNLGYKVLGVVIETVTGERYPDVIQRRILDPIGMEDSSPEITSAIREKLAVGYTPYFDDRPWLAHHPLAPATWFETDTADGCLTATASDLAAYLRMLMNRGSLPEGGVMSPESFALMTQPVIRLDDDDDRGACYGYGLVTYSKDGHNHIGHNGGMVGYISGMVGDMDSGLGAVALVNGPTDAPSIARTALAYARSIIEGSPLPDLSIPELYPAVASPEDFAGIYRDGRMTMRFTLDNDRLTLMHEGHGIDLISLGNDSFIAEHPDFNRFKIKFGRVGERVVEVFHGPRWYVGDSYPGQVEFECPASWKACPGRYRSHNPWITNFEIVLLKGKLRLIDSTENDSNDAEVELVPLADGSFRIGADTRGPERIRFDTIIDGRARRVVRSGAEFFRAGEP